MPTTENHTTELILQLYRGVAAEAEWARGLDLLSDALRGSTTFFGSLGPDGKSAMVGHRADAACAALLSGPLATADANPFIRPMMTKPVGKAFTTAAMCGDEALVRSDVYQHALRPHGLRYVIGAMLEPIGRTVRSVSWNRAASDGDYDEEEAKLLDIVLPHLARAIHLRERFAGVQQQSVAAFAALDSVSRGIAILGGDLEVAFANREARRIFALDDGIRASSAGLAVSDRRAAKQWRAGVRAVRNEQPLTPAALPPPISVPRPSGKLPFALSLVPAPELLGGFSDSGGSALVVTIIDPERDTAPSVLLLRQIYGLTPVEAELAAALCDCDLKHAAAKLGISINTAKTHLQAIFQKVGVSRQSALVRHVTLHANG